MTLTGLIQTAIVTPARIMARNLKRYYQTWELRQQGKTYREIGEIMGFHRSRTAILVHYIDFKIKTRKTRQISDELTKLAKKYKKI